MRAVILVLTLVFSLASVYLLVKGKDTCSGVKVAPVIKVVQVGFIPLNDRETIVASDVLKGIGLSNGIKFSPSTNGNTVSLVARADDIGNPDGIITFLKELPLLPYAVEVDSLIINPRGINIKLKLYKRGIK